MPDLNDIDFTRLPDKGTAPPRPVAPSSFAPPDKPEADEIDFSGLPDKEVTPELREAPRDAPLDTLWQDVQSLWANPQEKSAEAVQALVDGEAMGIPPSTAYRLRDTIARGVEFNPQAAQKRSTVGQRLDQRWETGKTQNAMAEMGGEWVNTGDTRWLDEAIKLQGTMPDVTERLVPESRIEDAVGAAAEMMPLMIDSATDAGWKGLAVGSGFGLISLLAGQPELTPVMAMAGLTIGGGVGMFEASMKKESGLAALEMIALEDEEGQKISPEIVRAAATGYGIVAGALEVGAAKVLIETFPGGKRLFRKALSEAAKNPAVRAKLVALASGYAGAVTKETGIEIAQESSNIVFTEMAKVISNEIDETDIPHADAEEILSRLGEVATESAKAFSVIAAPGAALQVPGAVRPPVTPEQAAEATALKEAEVEQAVEMLTGMGMDEETARGEAERIADKAEELRQVFEQEDLDAQVDAVTEITDVVAEQLEATGRYTKESARLQADALYGSFFRVMAERAGITPKELFDKYGLQVRGAEAATAAEGVSFEQAGVTAPPFFSQAVRAMESPKFPSKAPGATMLNQLRKQGVKESEIDWLGLKEFVRGKKAVTKEELSQFIAANELQVEEVEKKSASPYNYVGNEWQIAIDKAEAVGDFDEAERIQRAWEGIDEETGSTAGQPKFSEYQLPGGEDYTELLLTLPAPFVGLPRGSRVMPNTGDYPTPSNYVVLDVDEKIIGTGNTQEDAIKSAQTTLAPDVYRGGHFDEPNIVAHVRFNTRTDAEGNKVLFLEEIQSDWASEGRKKGFKKGPVPDTIEKEFREADESFMDVREELLKKYDISPSAASPVIAFRQVATEEDRSTFDEAFRVRNELAEVRRTFFGGVPFSPLLGDWAQFSLKRMLRYAAENGFDKIAWISGEQTADRYDLSKQVSSVFVKRKQGEWALEVIDHNGRMENLYVSPEKLSDYVGKDLANKIEKDHASDKGREKKLKEALAEKQGRIAEGALEGRKISKEDKAGVERLEAELRDVSDLFADGRAYTGLDLKVGGEWATTLYDKTIPDTMKKLGKKYGAKVERVRMPSGNTDVGMSTDNRWYLYTDDLMDTSRSWETEEEALEGLSPTQQALPITPALKEAAMEQGFPLFQDRKDPKGRITFDPGQTVIDILKKADPSTFLHETGHFYLNILGDLAGKEGAAADLTADYQAVLDWLGIKDRSEITSEHHEKWARGFEAYLREGKAPSSALRAAFAQFQEWLRGVYRTLKRLDVELTPEVTAVMDRMLASETEIEANQTEIDQAVIDLVTEGKVLEAITEADIKSVIPTRKVKGIVRETTGLKRSYKMIREDQALAASWKKAEQSARAAFKAGKEAEAMKWKKKMADVILKANRKVAAVKTEKEKMDARRRRVRTVRDYLGLTDTQMKKATGRKNFLTMDDWQFKQFIDRMLVVAVDLQKTSLAKARVMDVIGRKRLEKHENYRRALDLPPVTQMTADQLNEYADILEEFQEGDVFLTERELETVDRTDLKGIRTWREAKERLVADIKKLTGEDVTIGELEAIKVNWTDRFKWDTSMAESNVFYELLVNEVNKKLLEAEMRVHEIENKTYELARKSAQSRKLTVVGRLIPQDQQILDYIEAPEDIKESVAAGMTPEQLDFAHFIQEYFANALEYLVKVGALKKGLEDYFVHIRRSFLETFKDDNLLTALMSNFENYRLEQAVFKILDEDTGKILPKEKFFQFSLQRTGTLEPTKNVTRAFLAYASAFEKKVALDELIPKIDIYTQSLTPRKYTPRGLEMDQSLKKHVYKYINNKKGRQIDMGFVKQGEKPDLAIRALRTFTTLMDLGLNIPVGAAAIVGEQMGNFQMLGAKGVAVGTKRMRTEKGKAILKKYEAFVGRSVWEEFTAPGKEIGERVMEGLFGLFHIATVAANKQFLLASLTKEEFASGEISTERLVELRLEMGRFRVVPGSKSLVGSTAAGGAAIQYKSWAVPIMRTLIKDAQAFVSDLRKKPIGETLTTREARELYRFVGMTSAVLLVVSSMADDDGDDFIGKLKTKIKRESLTLLQSLDPALWSSVPRLLTWVHQLGKNIHSLVMLEEYKTKPGLKGVGGLKKQFTPAAVRGIKPERPAEARR